MSETPESYTTDKRGGLTDWRTRPYCLMFYGKDDHMIVSIDLTEDQATILGSCFCPTRTDGLGDYDIDASVQMRPK